MHRCNEQNTLHHPIIRWTLRLAALLTLTLAGCSSLRAPDSAPAPIQAGMYPARPGTAPARDPGTPAPAMPAAGSGRGGYYLDDGPGEAPPAGLQSIPDAEPKIEPYSTRGNKPYVVFGKTYTPITDNNPLKQRGVGSWYGKKFHGQKTSSGELYDMYKMTAAHPTLPIPSYARVTNLRNGIQVIVRVNDRGPFHSSRIIDLSYTAALKLGYLAHGSSELEVERLLPDEIARMNSGNRKTDVAALKPLPLTNVIASTAQIPAPAPSLSIDEFLKGQENPALNAGTAFIPVVPRLLPAPSAGTTLTAAVLPDDASMAMPPPLVATPILAITTMAVEPAAPALAPGGFYLQFGAFGQSGNADAARQRLSQQWPPGLPALEVHQSGGVYRLYSGPFASRNDAVAAGRSLPDNLAARPLIVQR